MQQISRVDVLIHRAHGLAVDRHCQSDDIPQRKMETDFGRILSRRATCFAGHQADPGHHIFLRTKSYILLTNRNNSSLTEGSFLVRNQT